MPVVVSLFHDSPYAACTYGISVMCTTNSRSGRNDIDNTILLTVLLLLFLERATIVYRTSGAAPTGLRRPGIPSLSSVAVTPASFP